jgi:glycosyltransferase involved in cell wall biosynthesis
MQALEHEENMGAASDFKNGEEKMRILRISHASLTPALRERERALVRRFPDVDLQVVTTERWREAGMDVDATEDELFRVRKARTHLSKHIQLFAYDPRPIIAALREHKPHLVDLSHEPYSVACAEALTLCSWFAPKAPIVLHANQNIRHHYPPPFNWFEQRAFRRIAAAYVCSESVREVLRAKGFRKPAPIISYGVDTEAFRPSTTIEERSDKGPRIGFIGRLSPGKGLNVLGDALCRLGDVDWQALIVGDGPERGAFERQLAGADLLDRAELTGAVRFDLVPGYFKSLDVLVIPTQTTKRVREQFGRVIVEAMACGVPVIGSTCGAIPEVIGDAGLVFPEGDGEALAGALRQVLSDRALRGRLARAGRERVEEHYTWERVAEKTYDLFGQVMRTRKESALHPSFELNAIKQK